MLNDFALLYYFNFPFRLILLYFIYMNLQLKVFIDFRTNTEMKDVIIEYKVDAHTGRCFQDQKHFFFFSSCTIHLYWGLSTSSLSLLVGVRRARTLLLLPNSIFVYRGISVLKVSVMSKWLRKRAQQIDRKMTMV